MYKLCITDKYELHSYQGNGRYSQVGAFDSISGLKDYVRVVMGNLINLEDIDVANRFMEDTTHNTCEFGYNGYFTVSYYDENIEE